MSRLLLAVAACVLVLASGCTPAYDEAVAQTEAMSAVGVSDWAPGFEMTTRLISVEPTRGEIAGKPAFVATYDVSIASTRHAGYEQTLRNTALLGPGWEARGGGLHDRAVERTIASLPRNRGLAAMDYIGRLGNPLVEHLFEIGERAEAVESWAGATAARDVLAIAARGDRRTGDLLWVELEDAQGAVVLAFDEASGHYVQVASRASNNSALQPVK